MRSQYCPRIIEEWITLEDEPTKLEYLVPIPLELDYSIDGEREYKRIVAVYIFRFEDQYGYWYKFNGLRIK